MNAEERRRLDRPALVLLLEAAEAKVAERNALLLRWLDAYDVNRDGRGAYWCEACDCFPEDHDADCPVPATRTLLAQSEDV